MKYSTLQTAISEATRFLKRARTLEHTTGRCDGSIKDVPKEQGAVKRASMDLTRVLSELRAGR